MKIKSILLLAILFIIGCEKDVPSSKKISSADYAKMKEQQQLESDYDTALYEAIRSCWVSNKLQGETTKRSISFKCSKSKKPNILDIEISDKDKKVIYSGSLFKGEKFGTWNVYDNKKVDYKLDYRKFVDFDYSISFYNSIATFWATIRNDSDIYLKDIPVTCTFYSETNLPLGTKDFAILKNFPSYKATKVPEMKLGLVPNQAKNMGCKLNLPSFN